MSSRLKLSSSPLSMKKATQRAHRHDFDDHLRHDSEAQRARLSLVAEEKGGADSLPFPHSSLLMGQHVNTSSTILYHIQAYICTESDRFLFQPRACDQSGSLEPGYKCIRLFV
jgi:hypothetical protein